MKKFIEQKSLFHFLTAVFKQF